MDFAKIAAAMAFACAGALLAGPLPPAPRVAPGADVDLLHGVRVADPYRALEDGDAPITRAWSDAENARTRTYLDALPGRAAVAARLTRYVTEASPSYAGLKARGPRLFAIYTDPARQQPMLVTLAGSADPATRRVLLDPNRIDPAGRTAIDWFVPSPDGTRVAVSLSQGGSEDGTLHVYDVASGRELEAPIAHVQYPTAGGALGWAAAGDAFWYTRYPGEDAPPGERHFNQAVRFHRLGTPAAGDREVLGAAEGVPRTGEIFLDDRGGGGAVLASVQLGDGGAWQHWVLREGQPALRIATYADRIVSAAIARDGTVFGVSRRRAPTGEVLKLAAPYRGGFAGARAILPAQADAAIVDHGEGEPPLTIAGDRLFVTRVAGGPIEVGMSDLDGGHPATLPTPPVASVEEVVAEASGDVLYRTQTYLQPPFVMRWSRASGQATRTALATTSPVFYADAEVRRLFATSRDGTRVPLNVIMKKGTPLDGHNPVLLYGYGGYGINMTPSFQGGFRRLWLDAGGIYVVANLRGGGERGEAWHRAGMLTAKQNVFDDFTAAANALVRLGYTRHERLALQGGSNGGLLMGAILTQHPELARAVVSQVGIYDMVRYERDPNGAFNVAEFGSVRDPAQFRALYAYSPYHHVVAGTRYPAVLLTSGANDGRVNPLNSRKMAAALQAAQADPARPILLRTSASAGHGRGTGRDERIAEQTDVLMFLFDQLGQEATRAAR